MLKLLKNKITNGVTALDLSENEIETIPCCLSQLPALVALDLSNNKIGSDLDLVRKTPVLHTLVSSLVELRLNHNNISSIAGLSHATSLECLHLSHNRIAAFSGFETMIRLRSIDLSHNLVNSSLRLLTCHKSLEELDLTENPVTRHKFYSPAAVLNFAPSLLVLDRVSIARKSRRGQGAKASTLAPSQTLPLSSSPSNRALKQAPTSPAGSTAAASSGDAMTDLMHRSSLPWRHPPRVPPRPRQFKGKSSTDDASKLLASLVNSPSRRSARELAQYTTQHDASLSQEPVWRSPNVHFALAKAEAERKGYLLVLPEELSPVPLPAPVPAKLEGRPRVLDWNNMGTPSRRKESAPAPATPSTYERMFDMKRRNDSSPVGKDGYSLHLARSHSQPSTPARAARTPPLTPIRSPAPPLPPTPYERMMFESRYEEMGGDVSYESDHVDGDLVEVVENDIIEESFCTVADEEALLHWDRLLQRHAKTHSNSASTILDGEHAQNDENEDDYGIVHGSKSAGSRYAEIVAMQRGLSFVDNSVPLSPIPIPHPQYETPMTPCHTTHAVPLPTHSVHFLDQQVDNDDVAPTSSFFSGTSEGIEEHRPPCTEPDSSQVLGKLAELSQRRQVVLRSLTQLSMESVSAI